MAEEAVVVGNPLTSAELIVLDGSARASRFSIFLANRGSAALTDKSGAAIEQHTTIWSFYGLAAKCTEAARVSKGSARNNISKNGMRKSELCILCLAQYDFILG